MNELLGSSSRSEGESMGRGETPAFKASRRTLKVRAVSPSRIRADRPRAAGWPKSRPHPLVSLSSSGWLHRRKSRVSRPFSRGVFGRSSRLLDAYSVRVSRRFVSGSRRRGSA